MFKKLLVALITGAFALSVYAQAPKSGTTKAEPKGQTGVATEKAEPGKGKSDTAAKKTDKSKKDTTKAKKDATKAKKGEPKKDVTK